MPVAYVRDAKGEHSDILLIGKAFKYTQASKRPEPVVAPVVAKRGGTTKSHDAVATLTATISTTTQDYQPDVPVSVAAAGADWCIGTNLTLSLTLTGISASDARRLGAAAAKRNYDEFRDWLVTLIAKSNVHCIEVDAWVAATKPNQAYGG